MKTKTVNGSYSELASLARSARGGRFKVSTTADSTEIGVAMVTEGNRRASALHLLVPGMTFRGAKRAAAISLNGIQARQLFEVLSKHYESTNR